MQAVDSNSLNLALENWFEHVDVDRSGGFTLVLVDSFHILIVMTCLGTVSLAEFQTGLVQATQALTRCQPESFCPTSSWFAKIFDILRCLIWRDVKIRKTD